MDQNNNSILLPDFWNKQKKNRSSTFREDIIESLQVSYIYSNQFDWEKYYKEYPDIQGEHNELNAYKHWIELGKIENRCAGKKYCQEPFERFEYESYAKLNPDLNDFNEMELYLHWIHHGIYEGRIITPVETYNTQSNTSEKIEIVDYCNIFAKESDNTQWLLLLKEQLQELNWKDYLTRYNDLVENGIQTQYDTVIHWLIYGKSEGRVGYKPRITSHLSKHLQELVQKKIEDKECAVKEIKQKLENDVLKNTPMFIINLVERIDKKIEMKSQLKKIDFSKYHIYKAYDKNDLEVKNEFERYHRQYGRGTNTTTYYKSKNNCKIITAIGAVGLIKSTIELFKDIENMGLDYVIICEDDVCFHKSFQYMLKPIKCVMNNYDLLYIGYNSYNQDINNLLHHNCVDIVVTIPSDRSFQPFYGTYGYICNSKFRKNIIAKGIKWFINNNATIDYGFNIMTWENEIQSGIITGEQLVYPRIDDTEAINGIRKDKDTFYFARLINRLNYLKPFKEEKNFVFIIPSYNNEMWIEKNINSVLSQTYSQWRIIYMNDCSTDSTEEKFHALTDEYQDKVIYIKNNVKYGQAYNRYTAYNMCKDEEICIMLDGDDWLANKYVLSYLNIFMIENNVDMTYGTCNQYLNGRIEDVTWIPGDYTSETIENKNYRKDIWRAMHLRVMKAVYLKQICPLDFIMENNEFIICTTDMVESYPCLEMCNGRHKKITDTLMVYNRENSLLYPTSFYHHSSKQNIKDVILKKVKNIPPYQCVIQNKKVALIDIENAHYKHMIQHYKDNFVRTTDMFLVRNSLLHYYVDKLNKYDEIIYISEQDIAQYITTEQKEEIQLEQTDTIQQIVENTQTKDTVKELCATIVSNITTNANKDVTSRQKKNTKSSSIIGLSVNA
jgi:glycosyltransferase involved in cell wall biosynthesis/GR25 family glycosyltransferase involved in LPS biosynthesis